MTPEKKDRMKELNKERRKREKLSKIRKGAVACRKDRSGGGNNTEEDMEKENEGLHSKGKFQNLKISEIHSLRSEISFHSEYYSEIRYNPSEIKQGFLPCHARILTRVVWAGRDTISQSFTELYFDLRLFRFSFQFTVQ